MREIRFRALELDSPVGINWVHGYYVEEKGFWQNNGVDDKSQPVTRYYIIDEYGHRFDICDSTLGQLTGLKDKNGAEIYEGDIIKTRNDYSGDHFCKSENVLVYFEDGEFCTDAQLVDYFNDCEKIGDIHTTPELLK